MFPLTSYKRWSRSNGMVVPAATTEAAHEVTSSEKTAEAEEALSEET